MLSLGFTGTRKEFVNIQYWKLIEVMEILSATYGVLHHGGCVGADTVAHMLAHQFRMKTEVHPADMAGMQGLCPNPSVRHEAKPPLARNKDIVRVSNLLLAAPSTFDEVMRSGTWATIRYAREAKLPIIIVDPDGRLHVERRSA